MLNFALLASNGYSYFMKIKFVLFDEFHTKDLSSPWLIRDVQNLPQEGDLIFFKEDEILKKEISPEMYSKYICGLYKVIPCIHPNYAWVVKVPESSILVL